MRWKTDVLFLVCCFACLACMPLLIIACLIALICYAALSAFTDNILGGDPEIADVREVAQHLCSGNDARQL